ncbi:MAG: hypothetical protein N2169_02715 [bacterium]|nr:hypothetical protein [bacterium]
MAFDVFSNLNIITTGVNRTYNVQNISSIDSISAVSDGFIDSNVFEIPNYSDLFSAVRPNSFNTSYNPEPIAAIPEPNYSTYQQINSLGQLSEIFKNYYEKYNQLVNAYQKSENDKARTINAIRNLEQQKVNIDNQISNLNQRIQELNNQAQNLDNQAQQLDTQAQNFETQANMQEQNATMLEQQAQALMANPLTASAGAQLLTQAQALRQVAMNLKIQSQQLKQQAQQLRQQSQQLRQQAEQIQQQVNQLQQRKQIIDVRINNLKKLLDNINNYQEKIRESLRKLVEHIKMIYKRAQEIIGKKHQDEIQFFLTQLNKFTNHKNMGNLFNILGSSLMGAFPGVGSVNPAIALPNIALLASMGVFSQGGLVGSPQSMLNFAGLFGLVSSFASIPFPFPAPRMGFASADIRIVKAL